MTDIVELFNACLYIQDNLDADLSLLLIARAVGVSKFRFHRIFKAWRGETLHDFVTRMRMERAAFELRYPDPCSRRRSIKAIAAASGYKSLSSFSHAFSQYASLSPRAFRNRALGQRPDAADGDAPTSSRSFFGSYAIRVGHVPACELAIVEPPVPPHGRPPRSPLATADAERYVVELLPDLLARATARAGGAGRTARFHCVGVPAADAPVAAGTRLRLAGGRYAVIEGSGSVVNLYRAWRRGFDRWLAASGECPKADRLYLRCPNRPPDESRAGMHPHPVALFIPLEDFASQTAHY